jgi:hypothetical protein
MSEIPRLEMLTGEAREAFIANFTPDEIVFEQNKKIWEGERRGDGIVLIGWRHGYLWKPSDPELPPPLSDNLAATSRADTLVPSGQEDR